MTGGMMVWLGGGGALSAMIHIHHRMLMLHVWLAVEEVLRSCKRGLKINQEKPGRAKSRFQASARRMSQPGVSSVATRGIGVRGASVTSAVLPVDRPRLLDSSRELSFFPTHPCGGVGDVTSSPAHTYV